MTVEREAIDFDVLIVGGGPAGLSGAIHLMRKAAEQNLELEVALIDKGAEIGAHVLSGAVLNPVALAELIPDYLDRNCPIETTVRGDMFCVLTRNKAFKMPMVPRQMHNKGFLIVSLSRIVRWMGEIAEELGVNIFPGFAGQEVLYGSDGKTIIGVRTGDKGVDPDGAPKANFEPGIDLMAKTTLFAEGARGSLMQQIDQTLGIFDNTMPQVFETGIKEVIELPDDHFFKTSTANDIHTLGYPLDIHTPGGGFIYEMKNNRITLGYLVGLGYEDPGLDPYDIFIRFKRHPFVADIIKGGKVLEQGARTVATGGYYSMPELAVDGGLFAGGAAGVHNSPALKGIHVSMKSGMLAAEAIIDACQKEDFSQKAFGGYIERFNDSWLYTEMQEGRNFAQALAKKAPGKFIHLGAQYISKGRGLRDPLTVQDDKDTLKPIQGGPDQVFEKAETLEYDGELYVDKLTGVYLSKTMHREDQPSHIIVHDTDLCVKTCYPTYGSPCTRFCPGNVYEIEVDETTGRRKLKLNPSNCLHCKTCDVKDPYGNITWTCPEGGEGPGYTIV
ncbi:Electron transfer flavoprotein-ubiquinone oxidoreductase (EC [Olavius algarvensis associated proteobacterium Delta 3]|nr:Electron transfer flavoprotein-ubiquinone oxidoreductase (EC [Olavius algarvensis associated proteobacterium Delta 3]CAB5132998.1 Electron transfer flavoprotein-ubiquinone oxidoreductase (EC [Olavius algarvensis associated proteobacterium Delta 3]